MPTKDRFSLSEIRQAAYCPRQFYFDLRLDSHDDLTLSPVYFVLKEIAYRYGDFIEDPRRATEKAVDLAEYDYGAEIPSDILDSEGIDVEEVRSRLRQTRTDSGFWDEIESPRHEETYIDAGSETQIHGTLDKVVSVDGSLRPSVVKTGTPPRNGVWEPQRVEATAAARLVESEFGQDVGTAYVEYPRHGVVRETTVSRRYERRLDSVLDSLREAVDGEAPSKTSNTNRCEPCDYSSKCSRKTSLLSRLRSKLPSV
ncbi:MAG: Dna2/Cas4 domain-containing protein [Halobacteria archaeon]|nr:Dna2/Cas4 domain-containing protein [Halobacteria archaeon]